MLLRVRNVARLAVATAALCGGGQAAAASSTWTYAEASSFSFYPVYDLGGSFEGLPQVAIDHIAFYGGLPNPIPVDFSEYAGPVQLDLHGEPATDFVSVLYGDCAPPPVTVDDQEGTSCPFPLEIQTWPSCMRNPALYGQPVPAKPTVVDGVPALAFEGGTRLELYTGNVAVIVFGQSADQVQRAANAVVLTNGQGLATNPEYAWYGPYAQFSILPQPFVGALTGQRSCNPVGNPAGLPSG